MISALELPLVFVDLETTGANASGDRITEIGIVEVSEHGVSEWSTLVNPQAPISPFIQRLTGISNEMVSTAPTFAEVAGALLERLRGRLFIAHNVRFDYGFLRSEFKRAGLDFRADVLCTVKLSRKLFPQHPKHNLDALVERHQLPVTSRHRALADARAIHAFWCKIHEELPVESIQDALHELLKPPRLPPGLDVSTVEDLPEAHGVYLFYGENDAPLFIGKSSNIRRSALAHFAADRKHHRDTMIAEQIRRIAWIETAGDLGAQLTESRLLKTLHPVHNPPRKGDHELCAWKLEPADNGGMTVRLVYARELDFGTETGLYGLFSSKRKAVDALREIAAAHRLCLIQLGLEHPPQGKRASCSAYPHSHCKGLCVGKEAPGQHDIRLMGALARMMVQAWPFSGPVGIRETANWGSMMEIHLIDHWVYLGSVGSEQEIPQMPGARPAFELDVYKLLTHYLKQARIDIIPLTLATSQPEGVNPE
ncbi:MAG: exonuclease domain-containing protein [Sulfurimicrobium sp.]|nr:exonuclease domain-containing protein [Sulfurimicrobium sp.]MDZ7656796.1 exonuclease domain-containing protein [Sulfurimicrobium sp.]